MPFSLKKKIFENIKKICSFIAGGNLENVVWQNCKTLKATTLAETSRSESLACCVIKISQVFNCPDAYIIYVTLACESCAKRPFL